MPARKIIGAPCSSLVRTTRMACAEAENIMNEAWRTSVLLGLILALTSPRQVAYAQQFSDHVPVYLQAIAHDYGCDWTTYGKDKGAECAIAKISASLTYTRHSAKSPCSLDILVLATDRTGEARNRPTEGQKLLTRLTQNIFPNWIGGSQAILRYYEAALTDGSISLTTNDGTAISMRKQQPADLDNLYVDVAFRGPGVCGNPAIHAR